MRTGTTLAITAALALIGCSEPATPKAKPPAEQPKTQAPSDVPAAPKTGILLIREGIGVGGVELGMTPTDVERVLGKPKQANKAGSQVLVMMFKDEDGIFDVYFDDIGRVRMIIAAVKDASICTGFDVCIHREGDLEKLKAHHGKSLFRFVDRDGSIYYRLLETKSGKQILTEYNPVEEKNGVVQVTIMYWTGKIDTSSFD